MRKPTSHTYAEPHPPKRGRKALCGFRIKRNATMAQAASRNSPGVSRHCRNCERVIQANGWGWRVKQRGSAIEAGVKP